MVVTIVLAITYGIMPQLFAHYYSSIYELYSKTYDQYNIAVKSDSKKSAGTLIKCDILI